jgi:L,D-transpeptidase YbiS
MKLLVSVADQTLSVITDGQTGEVFQVSTSKYGTGEEEGSFRTPRGLHRIGEKIGGGAAPGTVFRGRQPTGEIWTPNSPPTDEDLILTRILWLEGMEPHNRNSRDRYIYLHGTNQEDKIGSPASIGCIRLRNMDILTLYDMVVTGTEVLIQEMN